MGKFFASKILDLGSCAFRQPRATHSHCSKIHGYRLRAKFWFECDRLDENHWVVDFGGFKKFKKILEDQFDHTTCIAFDDPQLDLFKQMDAAGVCDLRVMPNGTGIERISEWCFHQVNAFLVDDPAVWVRGCRCTKVEVWEHEGNSAGYTHSHE